MYYPKLFLSLIAALIGISLLSGCKPSSAPKNNDSVSLKELFEDFQTDGQINPVLAKRYLRIIHLPADPGEEEVDLYLGSLYVLKGIKLDRETIDQLVAKIAAVGEKNVRKLQPYLSFSPFQQALLVLGGEKQKDMLAQALKMSPHSRELVKFFIQHATEEDSEIILGLLVEVPEMTGAVKKLGLEKKAVPMMKAKLLEFTNDPRFRMQQDREWLQIILENIPPAELSEFADQLWNTKIEHGRYYFRNSLYAQTLAQSGYLPAFHYLAASIRSNTNSSIFNQYLTGLTECKAGEFFDWYQQNKDNIVFDAEKKIFRAGNTPTTK